MLEEEVARRIAQLNRMQDATIYVITTLAEFRDDETGNHILRTQEYMCFIAEKMQMMSEYAENLTPEESAIMKTHTTRGHAIISQAIKNLSETGGFLEVAQQISRSHHEKWDGFGYPDGLFQVEIPLPARMMAVVDVYDAIRSARSYKEAQTHEQAVSFLREPRNHHFDPKIVDVFLSCDAEVERIRCQWDDVKEDARLNNVWSHGGNEDNSNL